MTEIQVYNDNFYNYYKKNIDILINAGFKPYAFTQYACEDTFIFHTDEEATEAYNNLKLQNKILCGWFYSKKQFEKIVDSYKKDFGISFPYKIYYIPYTDKEKSKFRIDRLKELVGKNKSNYIYISDKNKNLKDNLFTISLNILFRLDELNMSLSLLSYKTGINLFDIEKIAKGHKDDITLNQILTLNNVLNINICSVD